MIKLWEQGYDDVYGKRNSRGQESWLRKKLSLSYYHILQKIAKIDILPNVGDFRLLDKKCINTLKNLRETQRYTKGLYCWIGFQKKEITFDQKDRTKGKSSFNYVSLFNLAIEGITSYSIAPLRISTLLGIMVSIFAFCSAGESTFEGSGSGSGLMGCEGSEGSEGSSSPQAVSRLPERRSPQRKKDKCFSFMIFVFYR